MTLKAYNLEQYDKVFDLFERHGNINIEPQELRKIVRQKLATPENPNIAPHKALIRLSHNNQGVGRLVTTNFDELFECAYKELYPDKSFLPDTAPRLPVPKADIWNSIVYLHGSLWDTRDSTHSNIVLSSADFGRAYLVERWASRFVTELFRNFRVIFIGYQVEDPIMKYLVDALAAAREKGEGFQEPYAFVAWGKRKGYLPEQETKDLWKTKGINALTYHFRNKHRKLWTSLEAWADLHTGGFDSKRSLVLRYANNPPIDLNDPIIQNVCWALMQVDGNIAQAFADHEPVPPIEWLPIFDKNGLFKFVVDESSQELVRLTYEDQNAMTPVSFQLSRWLVKHLDKPEFLEWVLEKGSVLCYPLRFLVRGALEMRSDLLEGMKRIWAILASEDYACKRSLYGNNIHDPIQMPRLDNPYSIQSFLNALKPVPRFRKDVMRASRERLLVEVGKNINEDESERSRATTYADIDIDLVGLNYVTNFKQAIEKSPDQVEILTRIAHQLTDILLEIMNLYEYLSLADDISDLSYLHRPSISDHEQNRPNNDWTLIIELLRNSFDLIDKRNSVEAEALMRRWQGYDYPIFKRLILYAAVGTRDE